MLWADAVDLSSSFYSDGVFSSDLQVPAVVKSQAVLLYQQISKCNEEVCHLKIEIFTITEINMSF